MSLKKIKTRGARRQIPDSPLMDLQVIVQHLWDCPRHPEGCELHRQGVDGADVEAAVTRLNAALFSPQHSANRGAADETE